MPKNSLGCTTQKEKQRVQHIRRSCYGIRDVSRKNEHVRIRSKTLWFPRSQTEPQNWLVKMESIVKCGIMWNWALIGCISVLRRKNIPGRGATKWDHPCVTSQTPPQTMHACGCQRSRQKNKTKNKEKNPPNSETRYLFQNTKLSSFWATFRLQVICCIANSVHIIMSVGYVEIRAKTTSALKRMWKKRKW